MEQNGSKRAPSYEGNDIKRKAPAPEKKKAKQNNNDDLLCRTLGNICRWRSKKKQTVNATSKASRSQSNTLQMRFNKCQMLQVQIRKAIVRKSLSLLGGYRSLGSLQKKKYKDNILCSRRSAQDVFAVGVESHIPKTNTIHELLCVFKLTVATENRFDKFATCIATH